MITAWQDRHDFFVGRNVIDSSSSKSALIPSDILNLTLYFQLQQYTSL
jgi:hypothetical protein